MKHRVVTTLLFAALVTTVLLPISAQAQWGNALHFSWYERDRVVVPESPDLFPFVLNAGTVELWFKPDSVLKSDTHDPDYTYLFCKNISGNVEGDMGLAWKRGQGDLQCFIQDGNVTQDVYPGINIWEPRWYHVAFVWDTEDSMRVFIDGVQSSDMEPNEADEVCIPVYGGTQWITIGSGAINLLDARFETFRGTIDEVRLSAISRYKENFTPHTQPHEIDAYTVALWHFDEGEGDVAEDITGNGFTGTLGDPDTLGKADPEWVKVERDLKLLVNEVLVDPATSVELGDANSDSVRNAQHDEFVELINVTSTPLDLTGWKIGDDERIDFQFPDGYTLQPYQFVSIFGGGDVQNVPGYDPDSLVTRVFATGDSVGNGLANGGDYLVVQSADGNHDLYWAYGSKYNSGPPTSAAVAGIVWEFEMQTAAVANNNNSVTRSPDAEMGVEDPFVEHLTVSTAPFSPNTTINGDATLAFQLSVNVDPAGAGAITVTPDTTSYQYGAYVDMQAAPAAGFVFDHWSTGEETATGNPLSIIIGGNTSYTAHFKERFAVTPTIIVNELLADPATDNVLGDANGDGIRDSAQDEFVELANISSEAIDMTGWTLGDDEQISFSFPDGYMMQPGQITVVFGGGDISNVPGYNSDLLQTRVFVSDTTDKVGNGFANGGDFFLLLSPDSSYDLYFGYNSKYNSGPPTSDVVAGIDFEIRMETAASAKNNNSVTLFPDGDVEAADLFVEHNTVSDNQFSPGQTVSGEDALVTAVDQKYANDMPQSFALKQNYPNPFNPTTNIGFELPNASHVTVAIFNINGQLVNTIVEQHLNAGRYEKVWDATNSSGMIVPSGIYFYQINAEGFKARHKMLLLK